MSMRPSGVYDVAYEQDMAIYRTRVDWFWGILILLALFALPLLTSEGPFFSTGGPISIATTGIMTRVFIFIIAVSGLNILLGYTGQISLGHAAFLMVGAYSSQVLVDQVGITFWLAMPIAAVFTGLVGLLFGIPSLRVKGFYLAMATLAAQFMIPWFIKHYSGTWFESGFWGALGPVSEFLSDMDLGGATGKSVSAPAAFGYTFRDNLSMYYVCLVSVLIFGGAARNMVRSRFGRALISVRDNDLAAEQLGINVFRYKLAAFFVAAIYAGIAGSLFAHSTRSISPDAFNLQRSIYYLGMLIIGGVGFPLGPTFGVMFFYLVNDYVIPLVRPWLRDQLPQVLTFVDAGNIEPALLPFLFGAILMVFLIYEPRGLAYRWAILQATWRLRPFSQA
jgi:branched-chain amino acid transport system permease protein